MTHRRRDPAVRLAAPVAVRAALTVLAVVVAAWLMYQTLSVWTLAFLGLIVAAGIHGPAAWLEQRGLPRLAAVLIVYLALIALLVAMLIVAVPPLVGQLAELARDLPGIGQMLVDRLRPILQQFGVEWDATKAFQYVGGPLGNLGGALTSLPLDVITVVGDLATIMFLSALMLLERDRAKAWSLRFVAEDDRETVVDLVQKATARLGGYVRGQLLIMSVTGVGSAIGLTILGVPFALPLGVLAFLTEAIPLAGPILAGVVMTAVALLESPAQAAGTAVLVLALQQLESLVLVPVVHGRVVSIAPVVALLAVLSGSALGGIVGALIAIPAVAIATVAIEDVVLPWRRRQIEAEGAAGRERRD